MKQKVGDRRLQTKNNAQKAQGTVNINRKLELGQHCFCNCSLLFCKQQTQLKTLPHRQKKTKDVKLPQHHEGKGLSEDYYGRQVLPFKGWI